MARIYIETYGCTLNQADSDILTALIRETAKHEIVASETEADVFIINTCTVKGTTENRITTRIKSLLARGKKVVVTGCMSAKIDRIRRYAKNSPIVGTSSLRSINEAIDCALWDEGRLFTAPESKDSLPKTLNHPIMRIPINDGCTSHCAFCQTKLARPFLRSYSPKTIVKWVDAAVANGAKEIQLTGMDSGAYGLDLKTNLIELLDLILTSDRSSKPKQEPQNQELEYLIRLGMINPNHVKRMLPELTRLLSHPRIYKFIHIPVQTGSEKVCKEMDRDHSVKDFIEIVRHLRQHIPDISIATDIIVGYPTETKEDFEATLRLLEETKPEIINVARFSPRPGTKAAAFKQLEPKEMQRRSRKMHSFYMRLLGEVRKPLVGKTYRVLVSEKGDKPGEFKGKTLNYLQVIISDQGVAGAKPITLGDFLDIKIIRANKTSLFGVPIVSRPDS